jgi:hypothetical protein
VEALKLLIEAVITFGATFLGVYVAIQADDKRERAAKAELKSKLVVGLDREVNKLLKFVNDTPNLITFHDYHLECPIVENGIRDQVNCLSDKLIDELSNLRSSLVEMNKKFEVLRQIHVKYLGKGDFGNKANFVSNLRGEWTTFGMVVKSQCGLVLKLLKSEG